MTSSRPTSLLFLLAGFGLAFAACETERSDERSVLEQIADTGSTLACGAYEVPPSDSVSTRVLSAVRYDTRRMPVSRRDTFQQTDPVNPPSVEIDGRPPSPADAEPSAGLMIPVQGISPDALFDTFTDARGQGRVHNAIDIMAPRGVPVVAAAPGTVVRLFESERGGLTIYQLDPDGETVYYYAHLDAYEPGLEAGDAVRAGDPLGFVGDSGNAAPGNTHLHFAMWLAADSTQFWDGEPINPYPLLTDSDASPQSEAARDAVQP